MQKVEIFVAVLVILVAAITIGDSARIGFGWEEYGPAAGFVPFWLGVLMTVSALVVIVTALRRPQNRRFFVADPGMWEVGKVLLTSTLLTVGIASIGAYFATIVYVALFSRWLGKHRWPTVVVFAVAISLAMFWGVEKGLKISLPKSPLYGEGLFIF